MARLAERIKQWYPNGYRNHRLHGPSTAWIQIDDIVIWYTPEGLYWSQIPDAGSWEWWLRDDKEERTVRDA